MATYQLSFSGREIEDALNNSAYDLVISGKNPGTGFNDFENLIYDVMLAIEEGTTVHKRVKIEIVDINYLCEVLTKLDKETLESLIFPQTIEEYNSGYLKLNLYSQKYEPGSEWDFNKYNTYNVLKLKLGYETDAETGDSKVVVFVNDDDTPWYQPSHLIENTYVYGTIELGSDGNISPYIPYEAQE